MSMDANEVDGLDTSIAQSDKVIKRKGRTLLTDKSARPRK